MYITFNKEGSLVKLFDGENLIWELGLDETSKNNVCGHYENNFYSTSDAGYFFAKRKDIFESGKYLASIRKLKTNPVVTIPIRKSKPLSFVMISNDKSNYHLSVVDLNGKILLELKQTSYGGNNAFEIYNINHLKLNYDLNNFLIIVYKSLRIKTFQLRKTK